MSNLIQRKMRAAQFEQYGGVEIIKIKHDVDLPDVVENRVLIEVKAASLNPFDFKVRNGIYKEFMPVVFPSTLGGDFSGVIKEIGKGVNGFKVGDEVYGQAGIFAGGSGAIAEYALVNPDKIALKPKTLDHIQAAALPLVAISSLQALSEHIQLKKNQKILIHGGAGGIGSIAIQMAKTMGAYVATTVSQEQKEFVRNIGADLVIDYKSQNFVEIVQNYDAVFDTVGGETARDSVKSLKQGGILVSMVEHFADGFGEERGIKVITQNSNGSQAKLEQIARMVDSGKLTVLIDKEFSMDQIKEAFVYLETGHPKGKVVVQIAN